MSSNDWLKDAACTDADPDLFFAEHAMENVREAQAICRRCPVQLDCLRAGQDEDFGIWGGMLPHERRRGRTRNRAKERRLRRRSEALDMLDRGFSREQVAGRLGVSVFSIRDYLKDAK